MTWRLPGALTLFIGTVWAANAALAAWGVIPIGFGLAAPAGVFFAGIAFGLRDVIHELGGVRWVMAGILAGTALSYALSGGDTIPGGLVPIAIASAAAFLLAELADLAVYAPLRAKHWPAAVVGSNFVGSVVDSALFLVLAFGSTTYLAGQVVGKAAMIVLALPLVWWARKAMTR